MLQLSTHSDAFSRLLSMINRSEAALCGTADKPARISLPELSEGTSSSNIKLANPHSISSALRFYSSSGSIMRQGRGKRCGHSHSGNTIRLKSLSTWRLSGHKKCVGSSTAALTGRDNSFHTFSGGPTSRVELRCALENA